MKQGCDKSDSAEVLTGCTEGKAKGEAEPGQEDLLLGTLA